MSNQMINHNRTLAATFVACAYQAFLANITAVLAVPFMSLYDITLTKFGLLIGVNFATQMIADIVLTLFIDRMKYKTIVQLSNLLSVVGMTLYAMSPYILPSDPFIIMLLATPIFSFAGGMLEVVLSPIIDTIPDDFKNKKSAMSLMHSFYAWGQIVCIVYTSLLVKFWGQDKWSFIVLFTVIIPIVAGMLFMRADIVQVRSISSHKGDNRRALLSPIFILCAFAIMFGAASEIVMNQYISSFCEISLGMDKMTADMVGMVMFAACLGIGRLIHGFIGHKVNIHNTLILGAGASIVLYALVGAIDNRIVTVICAALTGFTVSLLWPGTLVVAGECFPRAGAWIFSFLAITGDVGAVIFPPVAGTVADNMGFNNMFLIMMIAPILAFICHIAIKLLRKNADKKVQNCE